MTDADELDWDRARGGEPLAFAAIFDRHRDRVYRHALRLASGVHDAEDVVAITFLELWRRRGDARLTNGSLLPWLLVTATNVSLNQRRASRRYRQFLDRLPHPELAATAEAQALASAALDLEPRLLAEIRGLPEPDRALIVLVALEGRPLAEAAQLLGITDAAARSRWQRLRSRLAGRLAPRTSTALDPTLPRSQA